MKRIILFLIPLLCMQACDQAPQQVNNENIRGLWMGGAYKLDQDEYQPFPILWYFDNDSLLTKNKISGQDFEDSYQFTTDSLIVGNYKLPLSELWLQNDVLHWNKIHTRYYHRPVKSKHLNANVVTALLQSFRWENEEEAMLFDEDGTFLQHINKQDEYLRYCYKIDSVAGYIYISKSGNQVSCENYPQFLEQLVSIDDRHLEIFRWKDDGFKRIFYNALPRQQFEVRQASGTFTAPEGF